MHKKSPRFLLILRFSVWHSRFRNTSTAPSVRDSRPVVENCRFRLVFHRKTAAGRSCGKLGPGAFQIGKKPTAGWLHPVKNKEKASTSFFIKGRMPTKSPANFQKGTGIFTSCIPRTWFCCGKPGGKSGKHRGKPGFFFTKAVENPVEKVECSVRDGKTALFLVVKPAFSHAVRLWNTRPRRSFAHGPAAPGFS
mgnify:FL=1